MILPQFNGDRTINSNLILECIYHHSFSLSLSLTRYDQPIMNGQSYDRLLPQSQKHLHHHLTLDELSLMSNLSSKKMSDSGVGLQDKV